MVPHLLRRQSHTTFRIDGAGGFAPGRHSRFSVDMRCEVLAMALQSLLWNPWVVGTAVGLLATGAAFVAGRLLLAPAAPKQGWTKPNPEEIEPFKSQTASDRPSAHRREGNPVEVDFLDPENALPP